jgi:hypothetical protein
VRITITAEISVPATLEEYGFTVGGVTKYLDVVTAGRLDAALEDLLAKFEIPLRVDNAQVAISEGWDHGSLGTTQIREGIGGGTIEVGADRAEQA